MIICADTVGEFNGKIIEKPRSVEETIEMLKNFSGKKHLVHTSVLVFMKKVEENLEKIEEEK